MGRISRLKSILGDSFWAASSGRQRISVARTRRKAATRADRVLPRCLWRVLFRFRACVGTMDRRDPVAPVFQPARRADGKVGITAPASGKASLRFCAGFAALNRGGEIVARASRPHCRLTGGTPVPLPVGSRKEGESGTGGEFARKNKTKAARRNRPRDFNRASGRGRLSLGQADGNGTGRSFFRSGWRLGMVR